jgi:hypothetical protein
VSSLRVSTLTEYLYAFQIGARKLDKVAGSARSAYAVLFQRVIANAASKVSPLKGFASTDSFKELKDVVLMDCRDFGCLSHVAVRNLSSL